MKLPLSTILEMAYYWLAEVKPKSLQIITGHSSRTITFYFKHFRKLVSDSLDFEDIIIGGEGIIVEIDEAKFGKNKYHRGHPVNGAWILGGVERTPERKLFLVEVPDRTSDTLLSIILTHVRPGSTIITDCFKSYHNMPNIYLHQTVNHSVEFVNSETGACTNTIEGTWNGIKTKIAPRNRTSSFQTTDGRRENGIDDHLGEFQWRRKNNENLWGGFLNALKTVEYNYE